MNRYVVFASPAVLLAAYIAWPAIATAGEASVVKAKATSNGNGYYFTVTVAHAWDNVHKAGTKTFTVKLPKR